MPKGGHNKKPSNLKVLHGTDQPCRTNENEPKPKSATVGKAPSGMDTYARKAWERLVPVLEPLEMLTEADIETFTILCNAYGRYERSIRRLKKVEKQVDHLEDIDVIRKAEVSVEKAEQAYRMLAIEFGLSPASRSRISVGTKAKEAETILDALWKDAN